MEDARESEARLGAATGHGCAGEEEPRLEAAGGDARRRRGGLAHGDGCACGEQNFREPSFESIQCVGDGERITVPKPSFHDLVAQAQERPLDQPRGGGGRYLPVPLYILVVKPTDPDSVALVERCLTEKLATMVLLEDGPVSDAEMMKLDMVLLEDGPVSDAEMIEAGNHLQKLCRQHEVNFVVESRVGVAGSVLSDGVQIDVRDTPGALPVRTVRSFLEDVRDDSGHGRFVLGQVVHSAEEARLADSLGADYLLVKGALSDKAEADPGDDWTSADVDPLAELARIRKSVKAHVVVTNEFCDQPGVTANSVLQCADGFQIPAQAFRKMFLTRDERSAAHLLPSPDRLVGAIALVAGCTVGAGIIALPVRTMSAGFLPTSISL
eukprot:CAMPEP_0114257228 /NCGR_PEP_ID=MMETSP0058-20121206/18603_1 /TAXON_ID=36894 /ORGANISM="Pyramimonas parkeae, CCMP726" /LENGTH=381 /DNA_ID=CAMNT_0001371905 /DNA_START=126 /DNA_END=1268 /DNA_ORIENTATION=-